MTRSVRQRRTHAVRRTWLVATMASACGATPPAATPPATPPAPATVPPAATAPVARDAWLTGTLGVQQLDRAELTARRGPPLHTATHTQPNRHDPSITDSIVVLDYADARIAYYVVTAGSTDLLDFAEVRSDAWLALRPPGIGTRADSLIAWWGAPVSRSDSTLEYDCATCEVPHPATFVLEDGRVRSIRFDLYVD